MGNKVSLGVFNNYKKDLISFLIVTLYSHVKDASFKIYIKCLPEDYPIGWLRLQRDQ